MAITTSGTATTAETTGMAATGSLAVNTPSGLSDGDVLVAQVAAKSSASHIMDWSATGWTEVSVNGSYSASRSVSTFVRVVADASGEAATQTFTANSNNSGPFDVAIVCQGFSGVDTSDPSDAETASGTRGLNTDVPDLTTSADGAFQIVAMAMERSVGFTAPSGFTLAGQETSSNGDVTSAISTGLAYKEQATAGLVTGLTWSATSSRPNVTATFSLKPAGDPPDPLTLSATATDDDIALSWAAPTTAGATHVDVFRRTPPTGAQFDPTLDTALTRLTVATTTYDDTTLANGTYEYQVFPVVPE